MVIRKSIYCEASPEKTLGWCKIGDCVHFGLTLNEESCIITKEEAEELLKDLNKFVNKK